MKRNITVFSACLCMFLPSVSVKAQVLKAVECKPKAELMVSQSGGTTDANYSLPVPLRNIATIKKTDNAVCNLLVRHRAINGGAWLLASKEREVVFNDASKNSPTAWEWTIPGATESSLQTQNAAAKYATQGVFDFPTLEVTTAGGKSSYHADLKMKAGGTSEITTIDMRQWGSTYQLTMLPFNDGINVGGCLGGTNNKGIVGVGNLFMIGTDEAYLDGVNVYLHHKPTKYKANAKLVLKIWMVQIPKTGDLKFTTTPVEAQTLKMEDIKADGEDGAWAPVEGGAVAAFRFDTPLDLFGKGLFFVSVEGFSNDPATEDFCILTDQIGTNLSGVDVNNRLAHNSFARLKGETDYLRPISSYGGGTGSFAICPLIRIPMATTGISSAQNGTSKVFHATYANGALTLSTNHSGIVKVFDLTGKLVRNIEVQSGTASISMPELNSGVYIVQGPRGENVKLAF